MRSIALPLLFLSANAAAKNIVVSDDDGWATAQIRQSVTGLIAAGHNVSGLPIIWRRLQRAKTPI